MSRYCPLLNRKVVYLECNECEDKVCNGVANEAPEKLSVEETPGNTEEDL